MECLIAAINAANANGQANTITLAAGTYTLTAIHNGTTPDTNGLPVITSTLTIMGAGAATTSIERAASAPAFRLLKVAATGTLTLQGLTLRGGNSPSSGGGIYNLGTLTLTDCSLTANQAPGHGGGIANGGVIGGIFNNGGTVTLTNCALTNNNGSGGGIANVGGTMTVANSSLAYNSATWVAASTTSTTAP